MTTIRNRRAKFIFSLIELVGSADAMIFRLVSKEILESLKRLEQLFGGGDPGAKLPRWVVPDMLRVSALEVRHPMRFLVLMKADDLSVQGLGPLPRRFGREPVGEGGWDRDRPGRPEENVCPKTHS